MHGRDGVSQVSHGRQLTAQAAAAASSADKQFRFAIDRGGTFTDVFAEV